jgi:uncharacterized protein (DUF488 family)
MHLIYSIGHGNRSEEAFIATLRCFRVENLADVRSHPGSRRNPQFNREHLEQSLGKAGISYTWFPDLGGFRRKGLGASSPHLALLSPGLRNYADHLRSAAFGAAVRRLHRLSIAGITCIMCAETLPHRCHRLLLSDYLWVQGTRVIHILDSERSRVHRLSRHARVEGDSIIYDRIDSQQLPLGTL